MPLVIDDAVRETTTTEGTGALDLGGAITGSFSAFGDVMSDGDTTYYVVVDKVAGEREVGIGTYVASSDTLERTTVLSSTTGSKLDLQGGLKPVAMTAPADRSVVMDASPSDGQVPVRSGSGYTPKAESDVAVEPDNLQGDSIPANPSSGEILRYDGTAWGHVPEAHLGVGRARYVEDFGAGENEAPSTNATAIQNAVDDAPEGGVVVLPPVGLEIDSDISIDKRLTFRGMGLTTGSRSMTPMKGSHLIVKSPDTHGLHLFLDQEAVNLHDFGVLFDSGLSSTGHGIFADAPTSTRGDATSGSRGLNQSYWSNIAVSGHDGDHYAYKIVNALYCDYQYCQSSGGGWFKFVNDHPSIHFGNSNVIGGFGQIGNLGTAHNIHFNAINERLNFISLIGLDPRVAGNADESTQKLIESTGNVAFMSVIGGNWENPNSAKINLPQPGGMFQPSHMSEALTIESGQNDLAPPLDQKFEGGVLVTRDGHINSPGSDTEGYVQIIDSRSGLLVGLRVLQENANEYSVIDVGAGLGGQYRFLDDGGTFKASLASLKSDNWDIRWWAGETGGYLRNYGLNLNPQDSAPSSPTNGDMAYADGVNWDPAGDGSEGLFVYVNGSWMATQATT